MNDITICIKTFIRPKSLDKCLTSIRSKYEKVKILVANDGLEPIENEKATTIYNLPFDIGLSAGRNFLLEKVTTPYIMFIDDDTIFTQDSNVDGMLETLKSINNIDLISGKTKGNYFYGTLEIENDILYRNFKSYRSVQQGYKIYDFVPNIFVAKTNKIKKVKWNQNLKIVEHMDFFWRAKNVIKSTVHESYFLNTRERPSDDYYNHRIGRIKYFHKLQCDAIGVKDIENRTIK